MQEEAEKIVCYDLDGNEVITEALKNLLNEFPLLPDDMEIAFSKLEENSGIAFYPVSGAVIATERKSVTGKVTQICNYPFAVVYRSSVGASGANINIKEFLDSLGRWLEGQPVTDGTQRYSLKGYPALSGNRKITEIVRQTPSYPETPDENGVQNWVINLAFRYRNVFYRKNI